MDDYQKCLLPSVELPSAVFPAGRLAMAKQINRRPVIFTGRISRALSGLLINSMVLSNGQMARPLLNYDSVRKRPGANALGGKMTIRTSMCNAAFGLAAMTVVGCAGGPMTTREKGAGIGAVGGAAAGGLIGTAFGRPGMGAAIGAGVGLGTGALVGDYMQGQEQAEYQYNQQQVQQNQRVIERNHQEIQRHQSAEY
jgi:hypothetical protein